VHSVELLGGGVRMPRVKKILDDYFKAAKLELGQHMNGDEAMAMGAAFRAANLSTAFRVRKVGVQDMSSFGVSVRLETLPEGEEKKGGLFGGLLGGKKGDKKGDKDEEEWVKHTTVFPAKSAVPSKPKTVAFNYDKDILCKIEYDDESSPLLPAGTAKTLGVFNIRYAAKTIVGC
jgi:hypoxia up-regulated 1